jgi:hypothetical protein
MVLPLDIQYNVYEKRENQPVTNRIIITGYEQLPYN